MALELPVPASGWYDLECGQCGLVASVVINVKPIKKLNRAINKTNKGVQK
jgi:hypothetical protein